MRTLAVTVLCWLVPALAAADVCAPEITLRRATVLHQGQAGIWFHDAVARCMLIELSQLAPLRERVGLLEQRLRLSDEQIRDLDLARGMAVAQVDETLRQSQILVHQRNEAIASRDAWWRSPVLWLSVGMGLAGGLLVTAFLTLR